VPDRGGQGEESLGDTGVESGGGAGAVGFEGKLSFAGVVDRFDELANAAEVSDLAGFAFAVGRTNSTPSSAARR
jgi:hypothetical protein